MRAMAAERGLSILELSQVAERGDAIDREIDERTRMLGADGDDFVIDARLAWHVLPGSVKVFLDVSLSVAAQRIFDAGRATEGGSADLAATENAIAERTASESRRYETYYGIDYLDLHHYDLVVDTSDRGIDDIVDEITAFVEGLRH